MRDKAGFDAATLANNWGIGINQEDAPIDHPKGDNKNDSPKSDKMVHDQWQAATIPLHVSHNVH
jgi:hypothetical protein